MQHMFLLFMEMHFHTSNYSTKQTNGISPLYQCIDCGPVCILLTLILLSFLPSFNVSCGNHWSDMMTSGRGKLACTNQVKSDQWMEGVREDALVFWQGLRLIQPANYLFSCQNWVSVMPLSQCPCGSYHLITEHMCPPYAPWDKINSCINCIDGKLICNLHSITQHDTDVRGTSAHWQSTTFP